MLYSISLFLHITGALILFAGLGIELVSLLNLKSSNKQILIPKILKMNKLNMAAMALIILPGIHMMLEVWGFNSWIIMAFIGIIINSVLFGNVTRSRLIFHLKSSEKEENNISSGKSIPLNDPVLWVSLDIRMAIIIGIIFLMTIKPGLLLSVVSIISSIIIGLVLTLVNKKTKISRVYQVNNN